MVYTVNIVYTVGAEGDEADKRAEGADTELGGVRWLTGLIWLLSYGKTTIG